MYKIPSTPVYAICSDFVVLLIFRHIFPVLHPTQIELHTVHQLNSIRVWKESKERAALIPPSSSFFTTVPDPNLPSSLSRIPFLFFQYRIPCQDFGESCFPSTGHIPYFAVKKFGFFPSPAPYFGQSRIPRVLFRLHGVTF